jgi:hypothetical protein
MPLALLIGGILDLVLIWHAASTGRFSPWGYIILMVPGLGPLAYIVIVLFPEWLGSYEGQKAKRRFVATVNPQGRYRKLMDELAIADTIANREALAAECVELGKFDEAIHHYNEIIARPMGEEAVFFLGRARAEFAQGRPADTVATLDELRRRWPDYQSSDGHLLYARALAEIGRTDEAIEEYKALAGYFPGAEARVRYGLLLDRLDRKSEARLVLTDLLTHMRRAPRHVRRAQAEWIGMAEQAMRG